VPDNQIKTDAEIRRKRLELIKACHAGDATIFGAGGEPLSNDELMSMATAGTYCLNEEHLPLHQYSHQHPLVGITIREPREWRAKRKQLIKLINDFDNRRLPVAQAHSVGKAYNGLCCMVTFLAWALGEENVPESLWEHNDPWNEGLETFDEPMNPNLDPELKGLQFSVTEEPPIEAESVSTR
jgi:hypothetical protein